MPSYYTRRTDDDLQRIAKQQYQSYYDQLRRAAQQKADRETLALENQRAGIQRSYAQQQEESAKQYRQAYSQADREILRRGMQRSSYGAQRLANVSLEQAKAAQKIQDAQAGAEGNLDAQIAQLQGQLADTMAGYDAGQAADIMARYNELQAEEYDRAREAEQYAESIRQFQTQYDEGIREFNILHPQTPAAAGGSSSFTPKPAPGPGTGNGSENPGLTDESLINAYLADQANKNRGRSLATTDTIGKATTTPMSIAKVVAPNRLIRRYDTMK